jgi:hypothetical protein
MWNFSDSASHEKTIMKKIVLIACVVVIAITSISQIVPIKSPIDTAITDQQFPDPPPPPEPPSPPSPPEVPNGKLPAPPPPPSMVELKTPPPPPEPPTPPNPDF